MALNPCSDRRKSPGISIRLQEISLFRAILFPFCAGLLHRFDFADFSNRHIPPAFVAGHANVAVILNVDDKTALVIVSASTIYRVLRIAYCVLRIAYCVKHDIISVIFNDTVQHDISIGLAETMIMADKTSRLPVVIPTLVRISRLKTDSDLM